MKFDTSRWAVFLCMAVFFVKPVQIGIWFSRVAEVQYVLGLSKSQLALSLLGMPMGLLPTLYFAGKLVDKMGPRHALLWCFPPMLLVGVTPGLAVGPVSLFASLFVLGSVVAFAEIGINVFAARVEKACGRSIMNRAHGFWSLGVMVGSLIGVQLAAFAFPAFTALAIGGAIMLPLLMVVAYVLPHIEAPEHHEAEEPAGRPIPVALYLIVVTVFGATLVEGGMIDWAAVYMREVAQFTSGREGLAVTVFSGFVTVGRFVGDAINTRFGAAVLARGCLSSALLGVIVLASNFGPYPSFVGFALVGLGVSTIFPLGVTASAALSKRAEARNVSFMTFGALSGFLIGPPAIGFMAQATSLDVAFLLLVPGLILSVTLAHRLAVK
ncbi:Fucose permease [Aliiroseovarius halocynthiae]|uniref:MFS transporter n=1 Tax=Aliiroseovarius halocynthiae TaxID=985055 RepID=A0A545STT3_9RHOB|nr:MFS transporter [Aliiroseovarius halocynthiae]TQV68373.1 MFS transporter [Aliiroseovarius halocynthiae]SMR70763.1 Fucose permease [Aliiroseovarius halocynthiae]